MDLSQTLPISRPLTQARPRLGVGLIAAALLALVAVVLGHARAEISARQAFERDMAGVTVVPPENPPEVSQASIDLALLMYGIAVPPSAEHPRLDMEVRDRGLTARGAFMDKARVTIGPAAFASWALLGSTLAHELEVHCNQNFLAIYAMDLIGLDGTGAAERQAYIHELRNAKRFGLDAGDAAMIADTMEYYYPDNATGAGAVLPRAVRTWLARNLLHGQKPL